MASVTKRGNKWYVHFKDATGKEVQRTTVATTKTEAKEIARELERVAWRQRKGLEPLAPPPEKSVRFKVLYNAWRPTYRAKSRAYSADAYLASLDKHLAPLMDETITRSTAVDFAQKVELLLNELEARGLAPRTLNHIRYGVFSVFESARGLAQRTWEGDNPIAAVTWRTPKKAGAARTKNVLRRDEVRVVLAAFPEPSLKQPWRWIAGLCLLTGARPGEALGAHKSDINADDWTWTISRSWDNDQPKDGEPRVVVIVPELRPLLHGAMAASKSERLFSRPDGKPFDPSVRHALVDHLRRALKKAGIVTGYKLKCRRKGCGFEEQRAAAAEARCPRCNMRLWVSPIPKPLRFYDLRHTHATLLRKAGVDIGAVQKSLGHSSPEITSAIYDHSLVEDFRPEVERALSFGIGQPIHAPTMQVGGGWKEKAPGPVAFANESEGFESGRQDSNLRPLGPEAHWARFSRFHPTSLSPENAL